MPTPTKVKVSASTKDCKVLRAYLIKHGSVSSESGPRAVIGNAARIIDTTPAATQAAIEEIGAKVAQHKNGKWVLYLPKREAKH